MVFKGIDVSHHNGKINWSKVKKSGIDFAIIRGGYGIANIDKCAEYNIENALANDIDVGVYWFSYAGDVKTVMQEAERCYNFIKKWNGKIKYPIYFDWEYDSYNYNLKKGIKCGKEIVSAMADAFCNILENYGYYAGIYTNIDYYNNFFTDTVKNKYGLWIAQWSTKCKIENFDIWQYGAEQNLIDSKYIDGISGVVDKNITYKNFPVIMETTGLNHIMKKSDEMDIDKNGVVDSYDALKILEKVVNSND